MALVVAIDFFIWFYKEVFKHGNTDKGAGIAAPVIVMEKHIRMEIRTNAFCQFQFPFCKIFNQVMHLIFVLNIISERIHQFTEVVALFKKSWSYKSCFKGFVTVYCVIHGFALIPLLLGEIQGWRFYIISPVFNVFYHDFIRSMYRKCTGNSFRERVCNTPGILYIFHTFLK